MRPLRGLLLAGLMALLPLAALAEPIGYAAGFDRLYRIDMATGQASAVGPIGFNDVEGLAISPGGVLYAAADATIGTGSGQSDFLIRIDPNTGAGTLVGALSGLQNQGVPGAAGGFELDYGLAFTADGRLWLSSDTINLLWEVDPRNGQTRLVGSTGARISGLAARGNDLFGVSSAGGEGLYRIDRETGQATLVGALALPDTMYDAGLDFDANGRLWLTVDYFSPPTGLPPLRNDLAEIDPETGAVLSLRTITGAGTGIDSAQMEGLAIAAPTLPLARATSPVPVNEPWLLAGLGTLMLAVAGARLRRADARGRR